MSLARRRLSPEASRDMAIEAARALLLEHGPQAVTLKAVAARIGRTHANLLHHFGSAEGLQRALMAHLADDIVGTIGAAVARAHASDHDPREVVELTFDAFDRGGAGARREAGRPRLQERQPLAAIKDVLQDGQEDQLLLRELELIGRAEEGYYRSPRLQRHPQNRQKVSL